MLKNFKTLSKTILLSLVLSACSQIQVKDYTLYGDEGNFGAVAAHTLLTNIPPKLIAKPDWDKLRVGMACIDAASFADIQATVDKLCAKHPGECNYQQIANFKTAVRKMLIAQEWSGVYVSEDVMSAFSVSE
jgi:hypothetical protein